MSVSCSCHTNAFAACSYPGGCGSSGGCCSAAPAGSCASGSACRSLRLEDTPALRGPLCDACLTAAEPEVRGLVYDYLDLAQLHEASMSQAPSEHTSGGGHESPILLSGHVEALQAEIVHVTGLWEHALRAVDRLHNPRTFTPTWRTSIYDHRNLTSGATVLRKGRAGALVQRAIGVIAPRLTKLATLPPLTVCPAGIEDEPVKMAGWEAVQHLQNLHARSRSTLGRTVRRFWIYGDCWACGARQIYGIDGPLWRSEPRTEGDPLEVHCGTCAASRPYPDYERYMLDAEWPETAVA